MTILRRSCDGHVTYSGGRAFIGTRPMIGGNPKVVPRGRAVQNSGVLGESDGYVWPGGDVGWDLGVWREEN